MGNDGSIEQSQHRDFANSNNGEARENDNNIEPTIDVFTTTRRGRDQQKDNNTDSATVNKLSSHHQLNVVPDPLAMSPLQEGYCPQQYLDELRMMCGRGVPSNNNSMTGSLPSGSFTQAAAFSSGGVGAESANASAASCDEVLKVAAGPAAYRFFLANQKKQQQQNKTKTQTARSHLTKGFEDGDDQYIGDANTLASDSNCSASSYCGEVDQYTHTRGYTAVTAAVRIGQQQQPMSNPLHCAFGGSNSESAATKSTRPGAAGLIAVTQQQNQQKNIDNTIAELRAQENSDCDLIATMILEEQQQQKINQQQHHQQQFHSLSHRSAPSEVVSSPSGSFLPLPHTSSPAIVAATGPNPNANSKYTMAQQHKQQHHAVNEQQHESAKPNMTQLLSNIFGQQKPRRYM